MRMFLGTSGRMGNGRGACALEQEGACCEGTSGVSARPSHSSRAGEVMRTTRCGSTYQIARDTKSTTAAACLLGSYGTEQSAALASSVASQASAALGCSENEFKKHRRVLQNCLRTRALPSSAHGELIEISSTFKSGSRFFKDSHKFFLAELQARNIQTQLI